MIDHPPDWLCKSIQEIATITSGGTPSRYRSEYWNGPIPWITTSCINFNRIAKADEYITELGLQNSSAKLFPVNTILMAMYGQGVTRGRVAVLDMEAATNQACAAITVHPSTCYRYVYYYLESQYHNIRELGHGGNQKNLNLSLIGHISIPLPPLPEQRKIAAILGTWDAAISTTERLVAALQERKRGLMQRLLTGQARLPEFVQSDGTQPTKYGDIPSDWAYESIGDIAAEVSAKNGGQKSLPVLSCTKYDGLVDSLQYFGRQIYSEDISDYKVVKRGQFAYATNHIEEGSIGYQDVYDEAVVSPMYTVFDTNDSVDDAYLYRLLKTELYRHIFEANTSGSVNRRGGLRWSDFATIRIPVPSLDEQRRIVDVLAVADGEIKTTMKLRDGLMAQKKGLMQRLLTGQVRVRVDEGGVCADRDDRQE